MAVQKWGIFVEGGCDPKNALRAKAQETSRMRPPGESYRTIDQKVAVVEKQGTGRG